MLFNSIAFIFFFLLTFFIYTLCDRKKQNLILLLASCFFYAYWDYRFLLLLALCTFTSYFCGFKIFIAKTLKQKKLYLLFNIILILSVLFTFKYLDFFLSSTKLLIESFGFISNLKMLEIILPLGISFYTFQSLSYPIDIYWGKTKPTKNLIHFALYISFFPQLIMGPIERSMKMLPQFAKDRVQNKEKILSGLSLALCGFFKKIVIADHLEVYTSDFFNRIFGASILDFILIAVLCTFQVYYDISGYIDIARGTARMLGFDLSKHFNKPFFAKTPVEFWNRWQITLASWFKDYLFTPLAIYFVKKGYIYLPHLITMTLVGIWHGADYKFLFFGLYWGVILILYSKFKIYYDKFYNPIKIFITFAITCFAVLITRIDKISHLKIIWSNFDLYFIKTKFDYILLSILLVILILIFFEGLTLTKPFNNKFFTTISNTSLFKFIFIFTMIMIIVFFRAPFPHEFKYFLF